MNALTAKEFRLIAPAFAAALLLAIAPCWILGLFYRTPAVEPVAVFLYCGGISMLALSSFGRELGLKTLSFNLAQPIERVRLWRVKISVLIICVTIATLAWWISTIYYLQLQMPMFLNFQVDKDFFVILSVGAIVLVSGGVAMTLLLRQVAAAFWLSVAIPIAIIIGLNNFNVPNHVVFGTLLVYSVAAYIYARWQFLHLQDRAWTGGTVSFGRRARVAEGSLRNHRPWVALMVKELQLQQVTLVAMAAFAVLNPIAVVAEKVGAHTLSDSTMMILKTATLIWCLPPLLAGCQCFAEERNFGTLESGLCLPVPGATQWLTKVALTTLITFVSAVLFWAFNLFQEPVAFSEVMRGFFLCAILGFYGSTLTSGVLQALGAAAMAWVCIWIGVALSNWLDWWTPNQPSMLIGGLLLGTTLLGLSYVNGQRSVVTGKLLRTNGLVVAAMLATVVMLSIFIRHGAVRIDGVMP